MNGQSPEVILAQEEGAVWSGAGKKKELEAEFGVGEIEGTLVLTDRRLIFVCTNEKEDVEPVGYTGKAHIIFSEVDDVDQIPQGPPNVFIPLASVTSVEGRGGTLERPGIEIEWNDGNRVRSAVVVQGMMESGDKKTLKDWAPVMKNLKAGRQKLIAIPPAPPLDTLQGKVVHVLSDMQERGVLEIEEEVEDGFKVDLDPDEVQAACDALASQGLLRRYPDSGGDVFYRRASPLGEDDLST